MAISCAEQDDLQHSAWHSSPQDRYRDNWDIMLLPQVIGGAAEERGFIAGVGRNGRQVSGSFRGLGRGEVFPQMPLLLEQI